MRKLKQKHPVIFWPIRMRRAEIQMNQSNFEAIELLILVTVFLLNDRGIWLTRQKRAKRARLFYSWLVKTVARGFCWSIKHKPYSFYLKWITKSLSSLALTSSRLWYVLCQLSSMLLVFSWAGMRTSSSKTSSLKTWEN